MLLYIAFEWPNACFADFANRLWKLKPVMRIWDIILAVL